MFYRVKILIKLPVTWFCFCFSFNIPWAKLMRNPSSRTSFNFPYNFAIFPQWGLEFRTAGEIPSWETTLSPVFDLILKLFSSFRFRVARSIFLLVFLISPAGLKLQEINSHFVFDLFCP